MKRTATITRIASLALCTAALVPLSRIAHAQDKPAESKANASAAAATEDGKEYDRRDAVRNHEYNQMPFRTFYLKAGTGANDANELLTDLRIMLAPSTKVYLAQSINAIQVRGTQEDLASAEKILADIDRPRKVFRLTYIITESDAGKKIGVQRFAMSMVSNGRTTLKNGSKVPVATGSYSTAGSAGQQTQFTYLDVGLNFDSTLTEYANGVTLRSKVEESSATEEKLISGVQEPLIRQSVLEGTSFLTPGVPLVLGSLDVAGSTRHLDVEVLLEPVR